jgi:aminoglycoside phosphotransferase (APT) family kinase protein
LAVSVSAIIDPRPRTDEARLVQALRGHSGAAVALYAGAGDTFVRKTAPGPSGNLRLRQQAIKQRLFGAQGFAFPAVRRLAQDAGARAFFEMDYVPGRTLSELVAGAVPFDRARVLQAVAHLIGAFAASAQGVLDEAQFHRKIDSIAAQSQASPAAAALGRRLAACDWRGIPQSLDHGDLTLENMLLAQDGRIVFIDCDAAWVSSWWLDIGKLFQDLDGRWFLRALAAPSLDALESLHRLAGDFRGLAQALDPRLPPRLAQLAALHLFRTVPYAAAPAAAFACAAAARLLEIAP